MTLNDCDKGLKLFLDNTGLPSTNLLYSFSDNAFISINYNKFYIIPAPINSFKNGLMVHLKLIESININDSIILFAKNYNSRNKLFKDNKISETEIVGFFLSAGFTQIASEEIGASKYYHFKRHKINPINFEKKSVFIKLERIGLDGKKINIYKFRTMYPFAKYLHKELINEFGFNQNGKVRYDFRVTSLGRFLRKYYLDEIPQLINLLKGDIQLVGCRPVSSTFLVNYPNHIYQLRLLHKPGVISPAIADNVTTVKEVIHSEYKFLLSISKSPAKTKLKVFIKAFTNVLRGKIKSL